MSAKPESGIGAATGLVATTAAGFEAEGRRELAQILGGARVRPLIMKGNIFAFSDLPEEEAIAAIAAAETEYVSRIVPVQRRVPITQDTGCFSAVAEAAASIGRIGAGDRFLVRCTRRGKHGWHGGDLERAVAAEIKRLTGATGEYEAEVDWLVSVEVYQGIGFVGVNRPPAVLQKVVRHRRKYRPGERPLNRAEWKIREALQEFEISLSRDARVLDIGAAPGGWTGVLAGMAAEVVAVDPADLDPRVAALPNVRHVRARADDAEIHRALGGPFDLITCDANLEPIEAAGILCRLACLLKPGAPAIMTIKYMTHQRFRHEAEAGRALEEQYSDIRMKHLPHNAHETTAAMRRAPSGGAAADQSK